MKNKEKKNKEKKNEVKIKINGYVDRRDLVAILADNGYKVKIKKEEDYSSSNDYFVILDLKK